LHIYPNAQFHVQDVIHLETIFSSFKKDGRFVAEFGEKGNVGSLIFTHIKLMLIRDQFYL